MRAKEIDDLQKRLLRELPRGMVVHRQLIFFAPFRYALRGFAFEPSGFNRRVVHVSSFLFPLFVPARQMHFSFGRRVSGSWRLNQLGMEEALLEALQGEARSLETMVSVPAITGALKPFARSGDLYAAEAYTYLLILASRFALASKALCALRARLGPGTTWQEDIETRAKRIQGLLATNTRDALAQLSAWEAETVANLDLGTFHDPGVPPGTIQQ